MACITKQLNGAVIDVIKTNHNAMYDKFPVEEKNCDASSATAFDTPQNGKRSMFINNNNNIHCTLNRCECIVINL